MPLAFTAPSTANEKLALTHRSFSSNNNERLEFLGDAVLELCISDWLFHKFPQQQEGELSRLRAFLVREETLHRLANHLQLGYHLQLGMGERRSGGARRPSILADALEALIGARYLDQGLEAARSLVFALYDSLDLEQIQPHEQQDAKTRLQELTQSKRWGLPQYELLGTHGAAHQLEFEVACSLPAKNLSFSAKGASKRAAEQAAAALLWKALQ